MERSDTALKRREELNEEYAAVNIEGGWEYCQFALKSCYARIDPLSFYVLHKEI